MTAITALNLRDFPPVEENIERPETLSQTLLAKHDKCPRSAYLSRRYKTGSIEMDRGIALHETLERCEKLMSEREEWTIPGDVAKDMAEAVMSERSGLVLPAVEQDRVRAMAWNWAESRYGTIDPETLVGIELPLRLELAGFVLTCRLDRVEVANQTLYLPDYKSGWPGRREDTQSSFQGQFYGVASLFGERYWPDDPTREPVTIGTGIDYVCFEEVFPRRRDDETGELIVLEGHWSRTELFEFKSSLERNVERFAASLITGDWPARDGSWCGQCPAPTECPIPEHLREVEQITSEEEAQAVFSRKLAHEREGRGMQTGLREWMKEHGPIFVGDYAFDAAISEGQEVKDWPSLELALYQSLELGVPFKRDDHIRAKVSTKYAKRKLTEEERDARA